MARIYVSSSFEDLQQERLRAADAIRRLGHAAAGMESYTASERRPLEVCLADLKECQGYVGIFAFRYGSLAPGHDKSFTDLEYEEAGRLQIPRLIFLLKEDAPWPLVRADRDQTPESRIRKLRDHVRQEHLVKFFSNADELATEVGAAVRKTFMEGRPIPEILPYLCDHSDQEIALDDAIRKRRPGFPLVCIVHGDEVQSHDMFLRRLQEETLPRLLGLAPESAGITDYPMDWPESCASTQACHQKLVYNLSREILNGKAGAAAEVNKVLASRPGPALIRTHLLTETWQRDGAPVLDRFLRFWQEWPTLAEVQDLLVFLSIQYQLKGHLEPARREPFLDWNRKIEAELQSIGLSSFDRLDTLVLPQLRGVTRSEALNWVRDEVLQRFSANERLLIEIRTLFDSWEAESTPETDRMPMERFALRMLEDILPRYNSPLER